VLIGVSSFLVGLWCVEKKLIGSKDKEDWKRLERCLSELRGADRKLEMSGRKV